MCVRYVYSENGELARKKSKCSSLWICLVIPKLQLTMFKSMIRISKCAFEMLNWLQQQQQQQLVNKRKSGPSGPVLEIFGKDQVLSVR